MFSGLNSKCISIYKILFLIGLSWESIQNTLFANTYIHITVALECTFAYILHTSSSFKRSPKVVKRCLNSAEDINPLPSLSK